MYKDILTMDMYSTTSNGKLTDVIYNNIEVTEDGLFGNSNPMPSGKGYLFDFWIDKFSKDEFGKSLNNFKKKVDFIPMFFTHDENNNVINRNNDNWKGSLLRAGKTAALATTATLIGGNTAGDIVGVSSMVNELSGEEYIRKIKTKLIPCLNIQPKDIFSKPKGAMGIVNSMVSKDIKTVDYVINNILHNKENVGEQYILDYDLCNRIFKLNRDNFITTFLNKDARNIFRYSQEIADNYNITQQEYELVINSIYKAIDKFILAYNKLGKLVLSMGKQVSGSYKL